RLDIALIKVQRRGLPVKFYTARTLDLGSTVEAIGHPKSFKFSITRGVISAIRRRSSINLPNGAGDEVLYIQTDTPVNSGNSGGPLFLGNKVVGVNTWVVDKSVAEGLNFAIHYSEVVDFLRENLPSFKVQG
ncbi:MAG: trypsin-like peptidase domain-containing protein, partial [Alphaproteobacteria bacterium]|nr:trypsin-like peptidase domain-containing protein [Alphaproteobacteria bacterium]